MAAKKTTDKGTAKAAPDFAEDKAKNDSAPPGALLYSFREKDADMKMLRRLEQASESPGPEFIKLFCAAIDNNHEVPKKALNAISSSLKLLLTSEPLSRRQSEFAESLGLKKEKHRPKEENKHLKWAMNYWLAIDAGMKPTDAYEDVLKDKDIPDGLDVSTIRKAVKKYPEAKQMAEFLLSEIDRILIPPLVKTLREDSGKN